MPWFSPGWRGWCSDSRFPHDRCQGRTRGEPFGEAIGCMLNSLTNCHPDMETNPFSCLLEALPLHSEEDDLREEISEIELIKRLPGLDGSGVVRCVRRLFEACGLLDARLLNEGKWAFVSFPASLLGHSLLQTLAAPGQQLFPGNYWRSNLDDDIEEQRHLLSELEKRREESHPTRSPSPVRYVYAAWGLIRLGDNFLLHLREDRPRPDGKNWTFPGGRFRPLDLSSDERVAATLRKLHRSDSGLAIGALERTLDRELREEIKLPKDLRNEKRTCADGVSACALRHLADPRGGGAPARPN